MRQNVCFVLLSIITIVASQYFRQRGRNTPIMERIVHGSVVDISDFPYQVALVAKRGPRRWIACGGSIIRPTVVFTAAHCTHVSEASERNIAGVLVGANYLDDPKAELHEVKRMVKHPDFNFQDFDHDFAVIVLAQPIEFTARAMAIPVATGDYRGGTVAMASGWGRTETGRPSRYLRATNLELESWGKCQDYFPGVFHPQITKNMVCVKPSRQTTYFGDSGGPLTIDGELVGLVSFGRRVRDNKKTTVFTRVKNFMDFVEDEVAGF